MTWAFIIAAVLAGFFFLLWEGGREKLLEADGKIALLNNRIEELKYDSSRTIYVEPTPLTAENMAEVVRKNGFIPIQNDPEWMGFNWQGEQYFISRSALPGLQFYIGFTYRSEDLELLKKAAEMAMEQAWFGRITFSEEDNTIGFRVITVEKTVEHFTDSFMEYMKVLNYLIDCHRSCYLKLQESYNKSMSKILS